ncbi:MAG TPA: hypothetical protein VFD39_05825 [Trueperaceae bacterium]|nr:hypothetical protein [Trueperaceae bacterium]
MPRESRRTTIYLETTIHRALKLKALEGDTTVSELVNEAVRRSLVEDAEDLAAFGERGEEKSLSFEEALEELRRDGKL